MLGTAAAAKLAMPSMGRCLTPNSFTGETAVVMADGSHKAIKDIKVGDQVLATDPVTGESGPRKVTALIKSSGHKQLVDISITDQDGSTGSFVSATEGHPFWVADSQEWVDAGQLRTGQWLQTSAGTWVQISAVRAHDEVTTVYNLTVDDLHTYHVSSGEARRSFTTPEGRSPADRSVHPTWTAFSTLHWAETSNPRSLGAHRSMMRASRRRRPKKPSSRLNSARRRSPGLPQLFRRSWTDHRLQAHTALQKQSSP
ncbi:polymorphic toxin-type HINT domain-containing protein [Streptomyces sp. F41]|uniref:polymorphic toxin-type HINT domain-containing protein n=1 Tax=Streptomyces sp. F41 TaxID=1795888 RepID=UPI0030CDFD79